MLWYFWIASRCGRRTLPDIRRHRIHVYTGDFLGGGHGHVKTVCGREVVVREADIVGERSVRLLRGRICKRCLVEVQAREVAEILAR